MSTEPFNVKVWTLHTHASRIEKAEKTLAGTANAGGVKWCGPFTYANAAGWWLYPPIDIDILWRGGKEFEHRLLLPWDNEEELLISSLLRPEDQADISKFCLGGRTKFTWGAVEEGVVQMWTGCIFETPPGWGLHIRSPINCPTQPYHIMEGILETDWLQYDIWTNLVFDRADEWVHLRRDQWPPLAHIVPIKRESYNESWEFSVEQVNRDTPEANRVFEYYVEYNMKKFGHGGKQALSTTDLNLTKDSTTYMRERKKFLKCPYSSDSDD